MPAPQVLSNAFSSAAPSLSVLGNDMYMVWKGGGSDTSIWWAKIGFGNWKDWTTQLWSAPTPIRLPGFATDLAPCLTDAFGTSLAMVWRNPKDQSVWWANYSGAGWSAAVQVPGAFTGAAPTATYYQGELAVAWRGLGSDQNIYWSVRVRENSRVGLVFSWSTPAQIAGIGTSDGPELAASAKALYLCWKGEGNDPRAFYSTYNGKVWAAQTAVPEFGLSQGPAMRAASAGAALTNTMWLVCKGEGLSTGIFYSSLGTGGWSAAVQVPVAATNDRPALACYDVMMFTAWADAATSQIYWGALSQISPPPPPVTTRSYQGAWTTPPGTPLGGSVTLNIRSDGTYTVEFLTTSTGTAAFLASYNFQIRAYLGGPGIPTLFFYHAGTVSDKGTDDTHPEPGSNPLIQLYWDQIASSATFTVAHDYQWGGLGGVIDDLVKDLLDLGSAVVGAAIGAVIGMTQEALSLLHTALGPGVTLGVIAGVAVFAIGAIAGFGIGEALLVGTIAGAAVGAVAAALIEFRHMNAHEVAMAAKVFGSTLQCANVFFTNFSSPTGRAMTAPGADGKTYCNFGKEYTADMSLLKTSYPVAGEVMIHELTHAWQIEHNSFVPGFVCSGFVNGVNYNFGDNIYQYGVATVPWARLNLEQQASIVNEWFAGSGDYGMQTPWPGMDRTDNPYYAYITGNILTGSAGYSNTHL